MSGKPAGGPAIEEFAEAPADDRRRRSDHAAERLHRQVAGRAGRRVAQMGVDQRHLGRAPTTLEIAQTAVVEVGSAEVQAAKSMRAAPLNGGPRHQVVWTERTVMRVRGAELVDERAIPGEEERGGDRL